MIRGLPFDQPGTFWKGNIHTHSTRSDGKLTPAEVVAAYQAHGYDFLALTDHFMARFNWPVVDTRPFRTDAFTTILGAELHAGALSNGEKWHILAVGLPLDFPAAAKEESMPALARRAAEAGAFVGIAHPNWYTLTLEEALTIDSADAVEIYNVGSSCHNDRGDSWHLSDQLSAMGKRLFAFGADDAHFISDPDGFGCWVHVKSESLDPDALLAGLKAGDFYTSQGPEIEHVGVAGGEIAVSCTPASQIFVTGKGPAARHVRGDGITAAFFPEEPFRDGYVRVTVIDEAGKRAWTNPVWP